MYLIFYFFRDVILFFEDNKYCLFFVVKLKVIENIFIVYYFFLGRIIVILKL